MTEWPSLLWASNGRRHRSLPQREGWTPDPGPAATHHGLEPSRTPGTHVAPPSVGGKVAAGGGDSGLVPASGRESDTAPTAGCTAASPRHLPWPRAVITCSRGQPAPADVPHLTDARRLPGSHTGSQGALLTERASRRWHRGTALRQRVVKAHPPWGLPSPAQDGERPRHCLLPARCHWRPFRDPICHRGWRPA